MKKILLALILLGITGASQAQISAKLMRYMDVSDTQITFVYGGDIWVMPKAGGTAIQVTHSQGEETWPKFICRVTSPLIAPNSSKMRPKGK